MVDTHWFLIYCTIGAYIINIIYLISKYGKDLPKYLGQASYYITKKVKVLWAHDKEREAKYYKVMNILGEG